LSKLSRGDEILSIKLERHKMGVAVNVKAHLIVEEFIQSLGGEAIPIEDFSINWHTEGDQSLEVYLVDRPLQALGPLPYTLDAFGQPLVTTRSYIPNLSFLRIKGISQGVKFYTRSVMSDEGMRSTISSLQNAMRAFYADYLQPITVELSLKQGD
jgi:hypothetical protein